MRSISQGGSAAAKRYPWPSEHPRSNERGALLGHLDPFRDRAELERVAEADDGARQSGAVGAMTDFVHEWLRDLEDVDREPLQVAQR